MHLKTYITRDVMQECGLGANNSASYKSRLELRIMKYI